MDVLEGSGLLSVSVNGHILTLEGLDNEVGDDSTIVRVHSRPVCVEDSCNSYIDAVLSHVTVGEGFSDTFALVVTGSGTDTVDVTPVIFSLRVLLGVTVHFGGGRDEESGLGSFGQTKHVQSPHEGGFGGLDRVVLVVGRRSRTCQVVNLVHFDHERLDNIVSDEFKVGVTDPVRDVGSGSSEEVVEDGDLVSEDHESINQMGSDETSSTSDQDSLSLSVWEEGDRSESGHGGVLDQSRLGVEDVIATIFLVELFVLLVLLVGNQVQVSEDIGLDLRGETELVVTNFLNFGFAHFENDWL